MGKVANLEKNEMAETADEVLAPGEGRNAKKRRLTRARLLEAAYEVMAEGGVDAAKIKDITDRADVGFGTFYNYFETKDELALQVLDCVINDFGQRNVLATKGMSEKDPALIMPVSIRLVLRAAIATPMWQWAALRPDLLVDRMREGFGPFGMRDMREANDRGIFKLNEEDIPAAWALAIWMMVGGIHDIVVGDRPPESETFIVKSIMRTMGVPVDVAEHISNTQLPQYPNPSIDWNFRLQGDDDRIRPDQT